MDVQLFIHIIIWPIFLGALTHSFLPIWIHSFAYGGLIPFRIIMPPTYKGCNTNRSIVLTLISLSKFSVVATALRLHHTRTPGWFSPGFSFIVIRLVLVSKFSVVATALRSHHTRTPGWFSPGFSLAFRFLTYYNKFSGSHSSKLAPHSYTCSSIDLLAGDLP